MHPYLILLAWGIVSAAAAQTTHEQHAAPVAATAPGPAYARYTGEMDAGMQRMMADMHAPGRSGNVDIDFLAMMIPHHQGAVEMARLELIHGRDPATRRLAEDIIASQTIEIEGMKRRLAMLRVAGATAPEEYPALGGTRGQR